MGIVAGGFEREPQPNEGVDSLPTEAPRPDGLVASLFVEQEILIPAGAVVSFTKPDILKTSLKELRGAHPRVQANCDLK